MMGNFRYWLFALGVIWLHTPGAVNINITTASVTEPSSARPTTLFRRIDVPKEEEKSSTTVDLFGTTHKSRRILGQKNWFDWSLWCQEQPRRGNCNESLTKYYYDEQTSQCLTFTYTGCGGGKNQFDTSRDCELYCSGSSLIPFKVNNSSQCSLQPKAGRCMGYFQRYYFDINQRQCKTFIYGGCNGNGNRFETITECMEQCDEQSDEQRGITAESVEDYGSKNANGNENSSREY